MISNKDTRKISQLLRTLGQPTRVRIMLAIGKGEACVCHLEAVLSQRQAYISQHLMALRSAKLLKTRRDGKYIYYRLSNPDILEIIEQVGEILGISANELSTNPAEIVCNCPHCAGKIPLESIQIREKSSS